MYAKWTYCGRQQHCIAFLAAGLNWVLAHIVVFAKYKDFLSKFQNITSEDVKVIRTCLAKARGVHVRLGPIYLGGGGDLHCKKDYKVMVFYM